VEGRETAIVGYRQEWLTITDPAVIATSGSDRHPILVPTGDRSHRIPGTVFAITPDELIAADEYEVDDYERIEIALETGEPAWVYVFAGPAAP
jgi:hypothetical protein